MLQKILIGNALFSLASGGLLVGASTETAQWFHSSQPLAFQYTGVVLLLFALMVYLSSKKQDPKAVSFIIIQDLLWVVASIYVVLYRPFDFSEKGRLAIAIIACIVGSFALLQYKYRPKRA